MEPEQMELGTLMKSFLDDVGRENAANSAIKEIRNSKKMKCQLLVSIMKERDLKVVRVLSHKDGPKDITLTKKYKKTSLTLKALEKILLTFVGKTFHNEDLNEIISNYKKPSEDSDEICSLSVRKLNIQETEPSVVN